MTIVSWPSGVNRIVTSESSVDLGRDGVKTDKSENGSEMSRPSSLGTPNIWSVSMWFSNAKDDFYRQHNNKTEWKVFQEWFKFRTRNGVFPFHFSAIDDPSDTTESAVYKIVGEGLPKGTPTGDQMKVTMTWKEVFTGVIEVPNYEPEADYIDVTSGQIDFRFTEALEEAPLTEDFEVKVSYNGGSTVTVPVQRLDWDGNKSVILYIDEPHQAGLYIYSVTYDGETLSATFIMEESDD